MGYIVFVNDDIDPSTDNLNIYSGANRFPDYKNINELQSDDRTLYLNPVNRNLHHTSQGNVSSKMNPPTSGFVEILEIIHTIPEVLTVPNTIF